MNIREILEFDNITIQCHDNPDADTLASGYALYCYLKEHGKNSRIIYSGRQLISKDNLVMFVDNLKLPIEYVADNTKKIDGLLVTVDCQYGARNVTKFIADEVMIIDHHQVEITDVKSSLIRSNIGSCSTIMWELLKKENFPFAKYEDLQTALYYGLYTDTSQFVDITNPLDKDMRDAMKFDPVLIKRLMNANMSVKELEIAGLAMIRSIVNKQERYAVVKSRPCDPNILGLISDFVLQVSDVDICVVFNKLDYGVKFSVRSCIKEAKANDVAAFISKGIGSGGGHISKAGGFIDIDEYERKYKTTQLESYFCDMINSYLDSYDIIEAQEADVNISEFGMFQRKEIVLGYVKATDLFDTGTEVVIRTLESDINIDVEDDMYFMIGIKGEVYPVRGDAFGKRYTPVDEPYNMKVEYEQKAMDVNTGDEYLLLRYAKSCISKSKVPVYAKRLTRGVKVFTSWDNDCYMLGESGDYLVISCNDLKDMFIVDKEIFETTYEEYGND